mmetsp:Transcript_33765/g.86309  ORF Transcript_33765/g.86309 Transcript_33765/m.86309 type:complete len:249 (+) Transcript_33765:287-1033(+)
MPGSGSGVGAGSSGGSGTTRPACVNVPVSTSCLGSKSRCNGMRFMPRAVPTNVASGSELRLASLGVTYVAAVASPLSKLDASRRSDSVGNGSLRSRRIASSSRRMLALSRSWSSRRRRLAWSGSTLAGAPRTADTGARPSAAAAAAGVAAAAPPSMHPPSASMATACALSRRPSPPPDSLVIAATRLTEPEELNPLPPAWQPAPTSSRIRVARSTGSHQQDWRSRLGATCTCRLQRACRAEPLCRRAR